MSENFSIFNKILFNFFCFEYKYCHIYFLKIKYSDKSIKQNGDDNVLVGGINFKDFVFKFFNLFQNYFYQQNLIICLSMCQSYCFECCCGSCFFFFFSFYYNWSDFNRFYFYVSIWLLLDIYLKNVIHKCHHMSHLLFLFMSNYRLPFIKYVCIYEHAYDCSYLVLFSCSIKYFIFICQELLMICSLWWRWWSLISIVLNEICQDF